MKILVPVLACLLAASVARAEPDAAAAQLYRDGQAAYDLTHYDDAIAAWQRSFDLSHAPALLYNIAQAYRLRARDGDCAQARDSYGRFIAAVEPSAQRTLAEQYIAQLGDCPSSRPARTAMSSNDPTTREIALGAGGVVVLVSGIYLGAHASTLSNDVMTACSVSCDWAAVKGKDSAGRRDAALGYTFDVVGAAALIGDAALYWLRVRGGEVHVSPVPAQGVALSWSTRW